MNKKLLLSTLIIALPFTAMAQRERKLLDADWQFAFGNAASPEKDYGCGTEYFTFITKANSIHNIGPYSPKFDASAWKRVNVPFDFVVDLPFAGEASHSHGYKTVGFKYPETSVGWYRKTFVVDAADRGKHFELTFDGIFRDAQVWVNGFYAGGNPSGYVSQNFDITDYINFGGDNLICVRADASIEEGWFYEGGGIYRHVWLNVTNPVHIAENGIFVTAELNGDFTTARLNIAADIKNSSAVDIASGDNAYKIRHSVIDAAGKEIAASGNQPWSGGCMAQGTLTNRNSQMTITNPHLWSVATPYLYIVRTELLRNGKVIDSKDTKFGIRKVEFDADRGLLLNGERLKIKGVNMHQDHAGVGAGMSDALLVYRIKKLKELGCNALIELFTETALEIGEGQQYDMDFETRNDVTEEEYIEMIRLKTSVLLACATKIGAIMADAPESDQDNLYKFGEQIGLAFQLQDDLLDVYGDPKVFGKAVGGDITSNKKTFMLINACNRANKEQRAELDKWVSAKTFDRNEKIAAVTKIYDEIGIRALCEEKIEYYFNRAKTYLDAVSVAPERKLELMDYSDRLMKRKK